MVAERTRSGAAFGGAFRQSRIGPQRANGQQLGAPRATVETTTCARAHWPRALYPPAK